MKAGMTFQEMAEDLAGTIDRIEKKFEEEKQRAISDAALNFLAGVCGTAEGAGNTELPEQIYRLMPYLKREG